MVNSKISAMSSAARFIHGRVASYFAAAKFTSIRTPKTITPCTSKLPLDARWTPVNKFDDAGKLPPQSSDWTLNISLHPCRFRPRPTQYLHGIQAQPMNLPCLCKPMTIISNIPHVSNNRGSFILPPYFESIKKTDVDLLNVIELPTQNNLYEKHAARLIVIRKRKMKKHKLQKLRKKMKFEWAKVRQRREMRKEKSFQAELLAQIKEAETFDAFQYVAEKLRKGQEVPIPRTWKGKRLPEFIIKEKLGIK